jgi:hypothetical protein
MSIQILPSVIKPTAHRGTIRSFDETDRPEVATCPERLLWNA